MLPANLLASNTWKDVFNQSSTIIHQRIQQVKTKLLSGSPGSRGNTLTTRRCVCVLRVDVTSTCVLGLADVSLTQLPDPLNRKALRHAYAFTKLHIIITFSYFQMQWGAVYAGGDTPCH